MTGWHAALAATSAAAVISWCAATSPAQQTQPHTRRSTVDTPVARAEGDVFKFLDNGIIKVGVDVSRGGSIGYLSTSSSSNNVINDHDMGREVQLSFYAGPRPYNPNGLCQGTSWYPWSWNPIGAGDVFGHSGTVLSTQTSTTNIHVSSRPLQWACNNVPCECVFNQSVGLAPGATWVTANATLINDRSDTTDYGPYGQELPATYAIGDLYQLVTYRGNAPFTNAPVENISTPQPQPPWNPGAISTTENWAAFVNPQGWGFGVYSPLLSTMLAGFHGTPGGGSSDDSTGYIAPTASVDLVYNIVYTYSYSLVLGDLATIRSFAYQQHAKRAASRLLAPHHDFLADASLQHLWIPGAGKKARDSSALRISLDAGQGLSLYSPPQAWVAEEVPVLYLRARAVADARCTIPARLIALPLHRPVTTPTASVRVGRPGFDSSKSHLDYQYGEGFQPASPSADFVLVADGAWGDFPIYLSSSSTYSGAMHQLKLETDAASTVCGSRGSVTFEIARLSRYA